VEAATTAARSKGSTLFLSTDVSFRFRLIHI
jgi:hypothetical protein